MYRDIKVLVVDDDNALRNLLVQTLSRVHFRTRSAATVSEALGAIEDWEPSGLVLDLNLPNGNGRTVLDVWHKGGNPGPVLVISGYLKTGELNDMLDAAWNVLEKPFDPGLVERIVSRYAWVVRGQRCCEEVHVLKRRQRYLWIAIAALGGTQIFLPWIQNLISGGIP